MNLVFLTLSNINSINSRGIYADLLRKFGENGHSVYIVSPTERKHGKKTHIIDEGICKILKVKTGNIQKTNVIEKGISTVLLEGQFIAAINKYFSDVKFDLVLYSTPPITLAGAVEYIKKRDGAKSYLLLKDIFPQNAVDMGMMKKTGVKGLLYKYFRAKEKKLYALSDRIGCMSRANVEYVIKNNPGVQAEKVEVCPNCIEPKDMSITAKEREDYRAKYGIPQDKKVFVYGGNLGRPQGISFLIKCLSSQKNNQDVFFLVVGDGTEYSKLQKFIEEESPNNVKLMARLPKEEYDNMIAACDAGMIFLDYRFEIPNFPSRLLAYMQAKLPVLACTDPNTDVGKVVEEGNFGYWCESNSVEDFGKIIEKAMNSDLTQMGENAYKYLLDNYTTDIGYRIIMEG